VVSAGQGTVKLDMDLKGKGIKGIGSAAWCRILAAVITMISAKRIAGSVLHSWQDIPGWEAYWIAQAIAGGNGYSFPSTNRWLFDLVADGSFYPTAWVDPLYTYILAGMICLFGDYHQLAAGVFNLFLLFMVFAVTYRLGERLVSSPAGVLAVLLLALGPFSSYALNMNNTMLAAFFIVLSSLFLMRYLDKPGYIRASLLGLVLGLTVLASPSAQLFVPVIVASIIFWGWKRSNLAVSQATLVLVMAASLVFPWAARNYSVFDEIVPVRNGAGQIAFIGVVATAGTVAPDRLMSDLKPEWGAETPRAAIFQTLQREKRQALERYQAGYVKEVGPPGYSGMNEAQRDKWFLQEAKLFLINNPVLSMKLAIAKMEVFVRSMGVPGVCTFLLAMFAGLLALKNAVAMTLVLMVGSYAGPFLLVVCYFGRYRAPIEPLVVVLAAFTICWASRYLFSSWLTLEEAPDRCVRKESSV